MNFRYLIGKTLYGFSNTVLSSSHMPITRNVPRGFNYAYDIKRFLGNSSNPVILDVGANTGQTSTFLSRYFPHAQIYAFEPIKKTYETLCENTKNLKNTKTFNCALGACQTTKTIRLLSNSLTNTLVDVDEVKLYSSSPTHEYETVQITTIDDFCKSHLLDQIDILKIDVEGYELEVLRGAKEYLEKNSVKFIYSEITFDKHRQVHQYFGELNEFLLLAGFQLYGFYEIHRYRYEREGIEYCNALFIRNGL